MKGSMIKALNMLLYQQLHYGAGKDGDIIIMIRNVLVELGFRGMARAVMGLLFGFSVCGLAQSNNVVKWTQPPNPIGWDVNMTRQTLADDFLCTQTGPITDIHLWTSFKGDVSPSAPYSFTLSLWSDTPVGPGVSYSHPNLILWQSTLAPSSIEQIPNADRQGWYDPLYLPVEVIPQDHVNMQRYNFLIPQGEEFTQTEGNIYWLAVQATPVEPLERSLMGWKTALELRNDDATAWDGQQWVELHDPLKQQSLDLAFEITTSNAPDGGMTALFLIISLTGLGAIRHKLRNS
jgi:hypothetical protein